MKDVASLNKQYVSLSPQERFRELFHDFKNILFTSSFGTTSAVSLHMLHKAKPGTEIFFLDTTYHFAETLVYKDILTRLLNLNVTTLKGEELRNKFTLVDQTWKKDPDLCCSINKVEPLGLIKPSYEVWVSGLMGTQNENRKELSIFEEKNGMIKFYPLIDLSEDKAYQYMKLHFLPKHPLHEKGYNSVGCTHCTVAGKAREGRWVDKSKTECGLHN